MRSVHTNYINILPCSDYLLYKILCDSVQWKPWFTYPKNSGKSGTTVPPIERCEPNQISTCVVNNKISSFTKFCVLNIQLEITQNFYNTHTEAHRHFPKIIKSCPGHFKMCKFIKNLKSKIFTKWILSSIYIEESKRHITHFVKNAFKYLSQTIR